ncbi:hypothetical protein QWA_17585, partial [Alcaligenes faecalis subsp. faecalis NCIB 8687]
RIGIAFLPHDVDKGLRMLPGQIQINRHQITVYIFAQGLRQNGDANIGIAILSQSLRKYVHRDLVAIDLDLSGQHPQSFINIMWQESNANPCVLLFIQTINEFRHNDEQVLYSG